MDFERTELDIDQIINGIKEIDIYLRSSLDQDLKAGRLNETTYMERWAGLLNTSIASTIGAVVGIQTKETDADRKLKEKQIEDIQASIDLKKAQQEKVDYEVANVLPKQVEFTERQIEGFDDNKKQKMLDIQMNAWAMMFSSGLLDQVPGVINGDNVSDLYCMMENEVGVPDSGDICDPCSTAYDEEQCCKKMGGEWHDEANPPYCEWNPTEDPENPRRRSRRPR